jgi:hypothetical protein
MNSEANLNPSFAEQNFFPSFFRSQVSTSRPFSLRHVGSSTRYFSGTSSSTRAPSFDRSILGSGDFTVMRGGTFYPEGEDNSHEYYDSSFYDSNTGRPFAVPIEKRKGQHYSDDPFADFKDFADITAGVDSDFSHLVVVYANQNSTAEKHEPRNILEILNASSNDDDLQQPRQPQNENHETEVFLETSSTTTTTTNAPIKSTKLSKFKSKLRSTKLQRKENKKMQISQKKRASSSSLLVDYVDALVADS